MKAGEFGRKFSFYIVNGFIFMWYVIKLDIAKYGNVTILTKSEVLIIH